MVPVPSSSSVATASTSWTPRSMPIYHIQLNKTDLRSPEAAAFEVGGGVVRCAHTKSIVATVGKKTQRHKDTKKCRMVNVLANVLSWRPCLQSPHRGTDRPHGYRLSYLDFAS